MVECLWCGDELDGDELSEAEARSWELQGPMCEECWSEYDCEGEAW